MSSRVYNCRVCGAPCASLDDMDHEALMDGATNLYAVHISCERKAYQQRNSRASARAEPRKPKVARAELEAAFERAKEEL